MVMRLQGEDAFCHRYKLATAITEDNLSAFVKTNNVQLCFPGASVVKHPPADAGDTGLIPDPGRSHMLRATKLCSRAQDPQLLNAVPESLCSATRQPTAMRGPRTTTRE